jgi:hypothetical protein
VVGLDDVANLEVDHLPIFSATIKIWGVFLHAPWRKTLTEESKQAIDDITE